MTSPAPAGVTAAVSLCLLLDETLFQCCSVNGIAFSRKKVCLTVCNSQDSRERPCREKTCSTRHCQVRTTRRCQVRISAAVRRTPWSQPRSTHHQAQRGQGWQKPH